MNFQSEQNVACDTRTVLLWNVLKCGDIIYYIQNVLHEWELLWDNEKGMRYLALDYVDNIGDISYPSMVSIKCGSCTTSATLQ